MLATDFIIDCLAEEKLDHLFLVPGGLVDPFLPALGRQSTIKPIVAAHEGGAAYMADGYARASGKFGAALCIGGPGLANTVTAMAAAQTDGSPVLLISGEASTYIEGLGMFQDASSQTLDDVAILKGVTHYSGSVDNAKNLAHLLRHAMLHLLTEPVGPVHLSIPKDVQTATVGVEYQSLSPDLIHAAVLSLEAAEKTLTYYIASAQGSPPERIVVLAGAGVEHAECSKALMQFAKKWSIPIATTLRAKGVFPEDHPLSLGVFGYAGTHHSRMAILDNPPDLLIVLGSGLNERDTMNWTLKLMPKRVISVNLNTMAMGVHFTDGSVLGDVGAYLKWLETKSDKIAPSLESTCAARNKWVAEIKSKPRFQEPENCHSNAVPIHPARIINELPDLYKLR